MEQPTTAADRWERLEALFHRALELPVSTRASQAREWCGNQPDLLSDLLEMLAADSSVERLLAANTQNPPPSVAALLRPSESQQGADPWLGRRLGPFLLERELGHGGMGVVYFGCRVAGGFTQSVAIKLVARHLHSAPAVRQFILERDTLARLEHKNIARLIDAGVTPEGTPYVAMEYIEGRHLDQVCDDPALSLQDKVQLVLQLCEAVAYVHRNLILHRDLKPSNVMVDSEGVVKLLDFGTLKLLGPAAQLSSEMTQAGMRSITLRYASPEHIEGKTLSTASDVYSLGMILYRLLAGHLPDGMSGLAASEYLLRLQSGTIAPPLPRRTGDQQLAADLSAIAMKAIRFEVAARYSSVDDLVGDLQRALDHRPVSARQGTSRYRLRRFVRRNRMLLSAAAAAMLVLGIGVAAMMHEASVARAQSLRADTGVEEERKLAHTLLSDYFGELKRIPASTDAQRRAVGQALQYLDSLNRTSVSPALRLDSIRAYTDMGLLQGSIYEENLGDAPGAIMTLRKAVTLAGQLKDTDPNNLQYLGSYISAERALGQVYFGAGDANDALLHLMAAADTGQHMLAMRGMSPDMVTQIALSSDLLGDTYGLPSAGTLNDPVKALARYKQAQDAYRAGLRLRPDCIVCLRGVAVEDWKLGMASQDAASSEAFFRDALASIAALPTSEQNTPRVRRMDNLIRQSLGLALIDAGRTGDGLAMILPAQQRLRSAVAADPLDVRARSDLALLDSNLANAFDDMGRYRDEMAVNQEFLVIVNSILRKDPTNTIWQFRRSIALWRSGKLLMKSGDKEQGLRLGAESLAVILPLARKPDAGPRILDLASSSLVQFKPDPVHDAPLAVSFAKRAIGSNRQPPAEQLVILAEAQLFAGDNNEAVISAQAAIKILGPHPDSLSERALRGRAVNVMQPSSEHP
jgi:serine/threonine protein kinase